MTDKKPEEISYKDMWLRLKAKVEDLREEAEVKIEFADNLSDFRELVTAKAWVDTVLHYMKEEENKK